MIQSTDHIIWERRTPRGPVAVLAVEIDGRITGFAFKRIDEVAGKPPHFFNFGITDLGHVIDALCRLEETLNEGAASVAATLAASGRAA